MPAARLFRLLQPARTDHDQHDLGRTDGPFDAFGKDIAGVEGIDVEEHLSGVEPATQPVEEPAGMAAGVGAAVADEDGWLHGLPVLIPLDGAKCSRTVAGHAPRRDATPANAAGPGTAALRRSGGTPAVPGGAASVPDSYGSSCGHARGRLVIAANNLYHDYETTRRLGAMAAREATRMGRRVAVVGVDGLSGSTFTREIDIAGDCIASQADEE